MAKAAARNEDMHVCPKVSPNGVPHGGGQIIVGFKTVWINGELAATAGDACVCIGEPDTIVTGSSSVYIDGKPAARLGDRCEHGGKVTSGSASVFIGGGRVTYSRKTATGEIEVNKELSKAEKAKAIKRAIKDCTALLEKKLRLLENEDPKTLVDFKKWFGRDDDEAKNTIMQRIIKALEVSTRLSVENFHEMTFGINKKSTYATIYDFDKSYRIFLAEPFWKLGPIGKRSKAGILIHEISHFKNVGRTKDDSYGEDDCLQLAKIDSKAALYNADSFEFFIEE